MLLLNTEINKLINVSVKYVALTYYANQSGTCINQSCIFAHQGLAILNYVPNQKVSIERLNGLMCKTGQFGAKAYYGKVDGEVIDEHVLYPTEKTNMQAYY